MKIVKKFIKFFFILVIIFAFFYFGIFLYTKLSPKLEINNANSFSLYDSKNQLVFQGSSDKKWVSLDKISNNLINATLSIEDKNFYKHHGFDIPRIIKALYENIKNKDIVQGASTISQQYSKNLFLDFNQSWKRKWDEMWITIRLEHTYTKDEILEGYLNTINYGHGVYGIENASNFYFNKSAENLTIAEASILAGIPNSPSNYSPISNYELSKQRQKTVLERMYKNNYINELEKDIALSSELNFYGKKEQLNSSTLMYYQDAVMQELNNLKEIPKSYIETGGLKIYTALDINAQTILEKNIEKYVTNKEIQTAAIMTNPNTGGIIALAGGKDYSVSQYNRAINAKRQPGSAIKPILYYAALENGFNSSTTFLSEKTTFNFSNGNSYSPKNYGDVYGNKAISLAAAIAYSENIYAVKTHLFLGENTLVNMAKRIGISSTLQPVASLPLGSNELSLHELITSYNSFANEGYQVNSHLINKIEDMNGNTLYELKEKKALILNQSLVFILNELLSGTYDSSLIDYNYPTCINIASRLKNKYAIKSGTTTGDVWIIGYNKNAVLGVWSGYDDNKEISSKDGQNNKIVWAETMEEYLKETDNTWYQIPNNVVGIMVDPITGKNASNTTKNKKILYYLKGSEPNDSDTVFDELLDN